MTYFTKVLQRVVVVLINVVLQSLGKRLLRLALLFHEFSTLDVVGEGALTYLIMAPALESLLAQKVSLAAL